MLIAEESISLCALHPKFVKLQRDFFIAHPHLSKKFIICSWDFRGKFTLASYMIFSIPSLKAVFNTLNNFYRSDDAIGTLAAIRFSLSPATLLIMYILSKNIFLTKGVFSVSF